MTARPRSAARSVESRLSRAARRRRRGRCCRPRRPGGRGAETARGCSSDWAEVRTRRATRATRRMGRGTGSGAGGRKARGRRGRGRAGRLAGVRALQRGWPPECDMSSSRAAARTDASRVRCGWSRSLAALGMTDQSAPAPQALSARAPPHASRPHAFSPSRPPALPPSGETPLPPTAYLHPSDTAITLSEEVLHGAAHHAPLPAGLAGARWSARGDAGGAHLRLLGRGRGRDRAGSVARQPPARTGAAGARA